MDAIAFIYSFINSWNPAWAKWWSAVRASSIARSPMTTKLMQSVSDQFLSPTITLDQVHAALAYYHDHRDEIEADIREADEFVEKLRAGQPSIFEKARQRNARNDSIPPG
jgi:hypothetical protein